MNHRIPDSLVDALQDAMGQMGFVHDGEELVATMALMVGFELAVLHPHLATFASLTEHVEDGCDPRDWPDRCLDDTYDPSDWDPSPVGLLRTVISDYRKRILQDA